jgi:hypothetical protein
MLKPVIALLTVAFSVSAVADRPSPTVVVMGGAESKFSVSIGATRPTDLLRAFSQIHRQNPGGPVHLLVPSEASIAQITNVLGTMGKAEIAATRVFVYSKRRDTMTELSLGCPYLFSDRAAALTLAHGRSTCP